MTVCPNDAFFKVPTPAALSEGPDGIDGRQQYLVLSELCNECGNCLTFCPENGDPAVIKPRLYLDESRFDAAAGSRFLLQLGGGDPSGLSITASAGAEAEVPNLRSVLTSEEGLPIPTGG